MGGWARVSATGMIWVVLPRATVALIVVDGRVTQTAPYVWRYRGRDARQVWRELLRNAIRMEWVPAVERAATPPHP